MTWHTPSFAGIARSSVRISARMKDVKKGQMAVQIWLSEPAMKALNAGIGDRMKLLVGAEGNLGWFRLQPANGETAAVVRIVSGHGKRSSATGLLVFSKAYLADVANVAVLSSRDAEHRFDGMAIEVKLPDAWLAGASDGDAKRDMAASDPGAKVIEHRADAVPAAAEALVDEPVPNCESAGKYAEAMPAPAAAPTPGDPVKPRWSATKRAKLRQMWSESATDAQLTAAFPQHTFAAIKAKATSMGLGFRGGVEIMGRPHRTATYAPETAAKPVQRVAKAAQAAPAAQVPVEPRRIPARHAAGSAPRSPEVVAARRAAMDALKEPIAFLTDAGVKVEPAQVAGTWFVDGEPKTARQVVQAANSLRAKAGLPPRYTIDDRTDRALTAGGGGSSLNMEA